MFPISSIFTFAIFTTVTSTLTTSDKFAIVEQLNLHQAYIDNDGSCHNAKLYASLYWPDASFRAIDPNRDGTATGHVQIRGAYDYDHSVFPLVCELVILSVARHLMLPYGRV
jgi:hypothetical protein